jgi:hypothetical protein
MKRLEDLEYFLTSILVHQCPFGGAVSPRSDEFFECLNVKGLTKRYISSNVISYSRFIKEYCLPSISAYSIHNENYIGLSPKCANPIKGG